MESAPFGCCRSHLCHSPSFVSLIVSVCLWNFSDAKVLMHRRIFFANELRESEFWTARRMPFCDQRSKANAKCPKISTCDESYCKATIIENEETNEEA